MQYFGNYDVLSSGMSHDEAVAHFRPIAFENSPQINNGIIVDGYSGQTFQLGLENGVQLQNVVLDQVQVLQIWQIELLQE